MMNLFNSWMSFMLAMVLAWAVMSHHIKDGIVVKIGLICLSLSFLAAWLLTLQTGYQNSEALEAVHCLIYVGLTFCIAGYFWRTRVNGQGRRASDWIEE